MNSKKYMHLTLLVTLLSLMYPFLCACTSPQKTPPLDPLIQTVLKHNEDGIILPFLALPLGLTAKEENVPTKFIGFKKDEGGQTIYRRQVHVFGAAKQVLLLKLEGENPQVITCYLTNPSGTLEKAITGTSHDTMHIIPMNEETQKGFEAEKAFWPEVLAETK